MKPVVLFAVTVFSQLVFASPQLAAIEDHELQIFYSELKSVESEYLRAVITIEILEEKLFETPLPENLEEVFRQLESLYKYHAKLETNLRELQEQWNQLQGTNAGSSVVFTSDQFKPIPIISKKYLAGVPGDSIPASHFPPLLIE